MPRLPINGIIHYIEHKNSKTLEKFPQQSQWITLEICSLRYLFSIHSFFVINAMEPQSIDDSVCVRVCHKNEQNNISFPSKCRTVLWTTYNKLSLSLSPFLIASVFFFSLRLKIHWKAIQYHRIKLYYTLLKIPRHHFIVLSIGIE